jgi:hypothetical protein
MKPFVKIFPNESFRIVPIVKTKKEFGEYRPWILELAILQER